jgi:hypothetical protein
MSIKRPTKKTVSPKTRPPAGTKPAGTKPARTKPAGKKPAPRPSTPRKETPKKEKPTAQTGEGWPDPFSRKKKAAAAKSTRPAVRVVRRVNDAGRKRVGSPARYWYRRLGLTPRRASRYPYPPDAYLKRLVEHFVTHEKGYAAVQKGCSARIQIELYPFKDGWTVFARYTRRQQEEKVDILEYEEFPRFAERVVLALLYGKHIEDTANLKTVLKADSLREYRTIKGTHHFTFTLGSAVKVGMMPTAIKDPEDPSGYGLDQKWRVVTPLTFSMGYRGRFNAWGIDAYVRGGVGLNRSSILSNPGGGHMDVGGLFGVGLNFLRYHRPHGMMTFYYGAGALFDLTVFNVIRPEDTRAGDDRDQLTGGGLNLNAVIGFEFMRASPAQFYIQLVGSFPVYIFEIESEWSKLRTYLPEASAQVGIMF